MYARAALLCLLTATSLAGRAFAQEAAKPDASVQKPKTAAPAEWVDQGNLWKPGDNNPGMGGPGYGDGPMKEELLKRFDKNGDGKLDAGELAEMVKARAAFMKNREPGAPEIARTGEEIIKRFDKDGDGKLDAGELAEMEKARAQMQQNGGAARFRAQIIKMFDKDGDGVLNAAEQAEADKFRAAQVKRFDKDGDGRLNDEERAAAFKAFVAEHPDMAPAAK